MRADVQLTAPSAVFNWLSRSQRLGRSTKMAEVSDKETGLWSNLRFFEFFFPLIRALLCAHLLSLSSGNALRPSHLQSFRFIPHSCLSLSLSSLHTHNTSTRGSTFVPTLLPVCFLFWPIRLPLLLMVFYSLLISESVTRCD